MSNSRDNIPAETLTWLDGMREKFGRVSLKHVKTDAGYEAGSESCTQDGPENQAQLASRVLSAPIPEVDFATHCEQQR